MPFVTPTLKIRFEILGYQSQVKVFIKSLNYIPSSAKANKFSQYFFLIKLNY